VTLLFAIRTPLSPPENHIDQYRYASIRSRDTLSAAARHPLRAFHVKPWEHQGPFVSGLFTSRTLLEQERGVAVRHLGVSQRKYLRTQRRSWIKHRYSFHTANQGCSVVSRETEVVFQRRSLPTWPTEP